MCGFGENLGMPAILVRGFYEPFANVFRELWSTEGGYLLNHMSMGIRVMMARRYYLERLRIPVLYSLDRGHLIKPIREILKLLHTVCKSNWKFFGEELGSLE